MSFFEQEIIVDTTEGFTFLGLFETLTDLQLAHTQPVVGQYAGVGVSLNSNESIVYVAAASGNSVTWQPTAFTVVKFDEEENITNTIKLKSTTSIEVSLGQSVAGSNIDIVDITQSQIIIADLANFEGRLIDLEDTYLREDLQGYTILSAPSGASLLYTNNSAGNSPGKFTIDILKAFLQDGVELVINKNQPNGYAGLDANSKIPNNLLPEEIIFLKGTFGSAQSTTGGDLPTTGNTTGDTYLCDTEGFFSAEADAIFNLNSEAIYDINGN